MRKLTKIVATISDFRADIEFIKSLFEAGVNVLRINTAHSTLEGAQKIIDNARKVSNKIGILIDTKGPEIRTTPADEPIYFEEGQKAVFKDNPKEKTTSDCIFTSYKDFVKDMTVGAQILIEDGEMEFEVVEKDNDILIAVAKNSGYVKGKKNINLPGVFINLPSVNEKDKLFIDFAIKNDVAFIAHSFVRDKKDVLAVKNILDASNSKIKIIAKIENEQGVANIDEILEHSYGIMVARGDLGIEISAEKIPSIQKLLIKKCIRHRKPVIVATQMLHSMIENPRPTRAEVSDVANAIYDGADAVMLSGETASGKYPIDAVKTMARIANEVEEYRRSHEQYLHHSHHDEITTFLAKTAVEAATELDNVKAIVADSVSGSTIRNLVAFRASKPIFAMCYSERLMRELALSYGVCSEFIEIRNSTDEFYKNSIPHLIEKKLINPEEKIVVLAGNFGAGTGASFIEISEVKLLLS